MFKASGEFLVSLTSLILMLVISCGGGNSQFCTNDAECSYGEFCDLSTSECGSDCSKDANCSQWQTCDIQNGKCIDKTNPPPKKCASSCIGCCVGETCVSSPNSASCGTNGSACVKCAAGSLCTNGACVSKKFDIEVNSISFPPLYTGSKLPTCLSHLLGKSSVKPMPIPFSKVTLRNKGKSTVSNLVVSMELQNYSSAGTTTISLQPGQTKTVELTPSFSFSNLFAVTSDIPGYALTTIKAGAQSVYSKSTPMTILNRNAMYMPNRDPYISVFVTPNDKKGRIKNLLSLASTKMPNKSMIGYQPMNAKAYSVSISAGSYNYESINLAVGNKICTKLDSVSGGTNDQIYLYAMDSVNFSVYKSGKSASVIYKNLSATTGTSFCFSAAANGAYYVVYENPNSNWVSRTVSRTRDASHEEIVYYQGQAIYDTLKAMGITYVNVTGLWWNSTQNINFPSETLSSLGGNCIDGTVLFASAFEAMGMRPLIVFVPGHAFVAVHYWDDEDTILPIETTMVGTDTYLKAVSKGVENYNTYYKAGTLQYVDIEKVRKKGISPAPM